jgi:hypothetical protein
MMPDKDHPVWKTLQIAFTVIGLVVLVVHGVDGAHDGAVDVSDVGGVASVGVGVKLLLQQWLKGA